MWALTGHPSTERLVSELEKYKSCGIDRILLYPRYGYEYEYMGEEWRRICYDCISFAKENNMKIWLYDEVNWPSGSCAGKVGRISEDYRARRLVNDGGKLVIERADPDNCRFAVDMLNPRAVDCFISLTHQKYHEWFGEYFGGAVEGIFTDEPGFSYFAEAGKPVYYEGAFEDYRNAYGRDAEEDFLSEYSGFYGNWYKLLGERFRETYLGRVAKWCRERGIALTGHLLYDNYICRGVHYAGDVLKALETIPVCGVDEIWNNPFANHMDFCFSQVAFAKRRGTEHGMAELFAYGPASLPYIRMRQMIWYAAAYGVDRFFTAIAHFDIRGNRVRKDFFHDFSPSSPDFFAGAPELVKSAKDAEEYANKKADAAVCIRYPQSAALEESWNFGKECQAGKLLWGLTQALVDRQITFDLICEEEEPVAEICFEIDNEKITEVNSGISYADPMDAALGIEGRINRHAVITEKDGSLASDILLRAYTDGSFVAVERSASQNGGTRRLALKYKGEEWEVELPTSGVLTDKMLREPTKTEPQKIENIKVRYNEKGVMRAEFFLSDSFEFSLEKPMNLSFLKRVDSEETSVTLDGKKLEFSGSADLLPIAAREFYIVSEEIPLESGKHLLTADGEENAHFPLVVCLGDFFCEDGILSPRDDKLRDKADFYGSVTVSFESELTKGDKPLRLKFDDNRLVTKLSANGREIGKCAFAPYVYEIPAELRGNKVSFELEIYTGYAPLFGDLNRINGKKSLSKNETLRYSVPERLRLDGLKIE